MYFVAIVLFVYNDCCFSFVSLCDHCIVHVKLVADVYCNVLMSLMCDIGVVVCVVYLLQFSSSHDAVGVLELGVQQSYGVFCFDDEVGPVGFDGLLYAVLHS